MTVIQYRMAAGVPGALSRAGHGETIETQLIDTANPPSAYGLPVKLKSGKIHGIEAADDPATGIVYGFLVRVFATTASNDALGTSTPGTAIQAHHVLRRGYMSVKNNAGTPALNGAVYVRVANAATGKPIGGIEAAADSGNCVAIPGAFFTGAADSNGITEISYNI